MSSTASSEGNRNSSSSSSSDSDNDRRLESRRQQKSQDAINLQSLQHLSIKPQHEIAIEGQREVSNVSMRAGVRRVVQHSRTEVDNRQLVDMSHYDQKQISKDGGAPDIFNDSLDSDILPQESSIYSQTVQSNNTNHLMNRNSQIQPKTTSDSDLLAQILESFPNSSSTTVRGDPVSSTFSRGPVEKIQAPTQVTQAPPHVVETLSVPKVILNPDLSSGLSVVLLFRHGVRPGIIKGMHCKAVYFRIKNCGQEYAIR